MITSPTAAELIEAVIGFIEQRAVPQLRDRDAFLAKVAVNALAAVKREIELGPQAQADAAERLRALLGRDGDFGTLNAELCDRLASGELTAGDPQVLAHLKATVIDQVKIDQPSYSGLKTLTS
ncbi:MAG TPA: DUF6285 domain-containing protein [Caulobacteraceae bacterium]|nr:DUF6285 domain-containing protein [Caulobacteraceae bacterium]